MLTNFWFDLKYALRLSRKSWGYSLMCASVVALSVGLAIWTYSIVYSQVLKPLGFPGSERWYSVQLAVGAETAKPMVDAYTYQELLKQNRSADHLGAFAERPVILSEGQATTSLRAVSMSPRLVAATQTPPQLGRTFEESDAKPGAAAVTILSFDSWQNYFAADPAIIGKTVRIDSTPVQVVGVMSKSFYEFRDWELWLPLQLPKLARPADSAVMLSPIIVANSDQNVNTVLAEMNAAIKDVNEGYRDLFNSERHAALIPANRMWSHSETPILAVLGFMSAAVLLLGCVNISMVFLARLLERSRELALRTALGSTRSRLLRQCLLETALIVFAGLVVGYGFAALGVGWAHGLGNFAARLLAQGRMPDDVLVLRSFDLVIATVSASAIWLLSTLIPARRISKQDAAVVLAGSGKGMSIRGNNRSVSVLVGLQVVVSCLVLVICASMVLSINGELRKSTGLDSARTVLSTNPTVFGSRYTDVSQRLRYWEGLTAAIQSKIPGAETAYTTTVPTRPAKTAAAIETQQGTSDQGTLMLPVATVSDDYFHLLGLSPLSGRLFDSTDNGASLRVAVVDEKMAARYWPGQAPIGKRVQLNPSGNGPWLTIVGVVSTVEGQPYNVDAGALYQSLRQAAPSEFQVLVKLPNGTSDSRKELRAAAFAVDRDLPLHNLQTFDEYLAALNLSFTAIVPVLTVVAIITAMLAGSGLFGLINRSVAQRTQEVGLRRALGATTWRATSMFLRQGAIYMVMSLVGVALGIIVTNLLKIPDILAHVLVATTGVVLLMAAVVFGASHLPSRRAVALEPGDALRYE